MSSDEFRRFGHQVVDWLASYFDSIEDFPVLAQVHPGDVRSSLPPAPPTNGESMEAVLADFQHLIVPGITHWNHPAFFAYFAITGSMPGILAEMLAAGLNVNAMLWRSSPAATELEEVTLDWLRQLLGLPESFEGVIYDTASISTLVAIAAARESAGLGVRERGMAGRDDLATLTLYCSEQAHSSVDKAAITLGIGLQNVRKVPTDADYCMDASALDRMVDTDTRAGLHPFCVVATVGTTSTTSVDSVPAIADICKRRRLWLHVDAAYGGIAAIVPEMKWVLEGVEHADSLVTNPHKWLFTPLDLSAFYSPHLDVVLSAFSLIPEYLRTDEGEPVRNYMDYGPQLGRRFRALKLWFILRYFGSDGIVSRLRHHIEMAHEFAEWISHDPAWEILAPVPFSTVCFRALGTDIGDTETDCMNEAILARVNESGEAFLSHTRLHGHFVLRLAVGNLRTQQSHISRTWDLLCTARSEYLGS